MLAELKKSWQAIGRSKGELTAKIQFISANDRTAVEFILSEGLFHDASQGRILTKLSPAKAGGFKVRGLNHGLPPFRLKSVVLDHATTPM